MAKLNVSRLKSIPNPNEAFSNMLGVEENQYVKEIPIEQLVEITDQPFRPYTEEALKELATDIENHGLFSPLIVRPVENKFVILAGRNRYNACLLNGKKAIPCIVKDVDDITGNLILVSSNLNQRHKLLPSEKAYAYKMQMDCMKIKSGERIDLVHNVNKVDTTQEIALLNDESKTNISYYIRLTKLLPYLLELVDSKDLPFRAGVELSSLEENQQKTLLAYLEKNAEQKITVDQARELKQLAQSNAITYTVLDEFFHPPSNGKKTKKRTSIKISMEEMEEILQSTINEKEAKNIILKALLLYQNQ